MPATRNSKRSRSSKTGALAAWTAAIAAVVVIATAATLFVASRGWILYYGDAEAHLNIARRILDSRTPGPEQIGTVWLPLPHVLMMPFVALQDWWRAGYAGSAVGSAAFAVAALALFGASRRAWGSSVAGFASLLVFALNPNLLYLQATPMTEPVLFAAVCCLLYALVCFGESRSWSALAAAAVFANLAMLSRYDGWFLLPFAVLWVLIRGGWLKAAVFALICSAAPVAWLAHNLWYYADPLEFYRGEWSAKAIYQRALDRGMAKYPGDHDWTTALHYFSSATVLACGWGAVLAGAAGVVVAAVRRVWWPILFLGALPAFYVLSMYSSGTPIFVPHLWPNSYYNTRYALAALPLLAFAAGALPVFFPAPMQRWALVGVAGAAVLGSVLAGQVVCFRESEANSEGRRYWTREAAAFLAAQYRPGDGIAASFGDMTGVLREAGIPLRESLHEGNGPAWYGAVARPELMLFERWALVRPGDALATALLQSRAQLRGWRRVKMVTHRDGSVVEIYRRHDYPLDQSARSAERLPADVGR